MISASYNRLAFRLTRQRTKAALKRYFFPCGYKEKARAITSRAQQNIKDKERLKTATNRDETVCRFPRENPWGERQRTF